MDSAGNFYFSKLYSVPIPGGFTPISIAVHKGYFDPNTARVIWGPPTVPFAAPPGTAGADKPHIAVDPNTSGATATVYLAFTDFNAGQVIRIVRSVDGASTWSAPITLSKPGVPLGAIPRVGPIGEIYVAWERNWAQPSGQAIMIAKATAWPSFSSELVVSNVTPLTRIPSFNPGREPNEFPTMGVDTRGRVYLAWNDGRYGSGCPDPGRASDRIGAILLTYSPDGLSNWSSFAVVNDDGFPSATCTDHFYPWLSIDPNDGVHLGWYDNRLRAPLRYDLTDTYAATFNIVGGVSPNIRLTSCTFSTNVQSTCQLVFGDYNGGYATIDRFHYAWGDGRNGDPDAFSGGLPLR